MNTTEILHIIAQGGTRFTAHLLGDNRNPRCGFLGSMEFGTVNADGQFEQSDDEVSDAAREEFEIDERIPARAR